MDIDCITGKTMETCPAADEDCATGDFVCNDDSDAGEFECNICFELAQDSVVTLCGHLYCWPCLYQWLQVHSYSRACPVCKALIREEKLVPIYGRGKATAGQRRNQCVPGVNVPKRPIGQRPQTAPPPVDINYFHEDELDPMESARFGNLTLSYIFSILPTFLSFQSNGIHDATVYGATTGVPNLFSSSSRGGYSHGLYSSVLIDVKQFCMVMFFVFLGLCIVGFLILW